MQIRLCYGLDSLVLLAAYWLALLVYFRMTGVHILSMTKELSAAFAVGRLEIAQAALLKLALA